MDSADVSIWDKFDVDEYKRARAATITGKAADKDEKVKPTGWRKWRARTFRILFDGFATLVWLYVPAKLFIGDFDRWIVSHVAPSLMWLLDYRFFVILTIGAVLLLCLRRWEFVVPLLYLMFFPLVVLLWKIPRAYYRAKSWTLVIGTVQIGWALVQSLRFAVVSATLFALAALTVAVRGPDWLLWVVVTGLPLLWLCVLARAVFYALKPSKFVRSQQHLSSTLLNSSFVWGLASPTEAVKSSEVVKLDKAQSDALVTQASIGLMIYGGSYFWAEQLENYRKSGISVLFNALSVVALAFEAVVLFTVANFGLFKIDRTQFEYVDPPQFATFVRYSLNSMFPGEINALQAKGSAASWLSVVSGFSFAVLLLVLVVSVVFSLKQSRDDVTAEESIQAMRNKSDEFADKLSNEYRLPLEDLANRIFELSGLLSFWTRYISKALGVVKNLDSDQEDQGEPNSS